MTELIQPEINRTFATGSGDWAGDIGWEPGPVGGKFGLLQLLITEPSYRGTCILQYPNISVIPGTENTLHYDVAVQEGPGTDFFGDGILSDGNYEIPVGIPTIAHPEIWFSSGGAFDIPSGWIKEQTTLTLFMWSESNDEGKIVFDNFSFTAEAVAKIQYLPLMGVG